MAQAARRTQTAAGGASRSRDHLRLVTAKARPLPRAPKPPASARARETGPGEAACRSLFQLATVVLVALAVLGGVRVALSARVAEASLDQQALERSIKEQSQVADRLELDRSLLVTPSRIASMAADLHMTKAPQLRYLAVPANAAGTTAEKAVPAGATSQLPSVKPAMAGVLAAARDITEKEARTLLVGDAGLAASR